MCDGGTVIEVILVYEIAARLQRSRLTSKDGMVSAHDIAQYENQIGTRFKLGVLVCHELGSTP